MTGKIVSLKPFIDRMDEEERNRQAYFAEMEDLRQTELEQEEMWRQHRAIHGFAGEDDIPVDDGYRYFDHDDPEHIMEAFDRLIEQQRDEHVEAVEALAVIKGFLERFSPQDDAAPEPELEIRDPSRCAILSTSNRAMRICTRRICPPSRRWYAKRGWKRS